jgi:Arm DNA-binding domain
MAADCTSASLPLAVSCGVSGTNSNRKEKLLSIGPYPSVGVAEAREAATSAKCLRREGKDPAGEKRLRRLSTQAIGVIKALRKLTGRTPYLFPTRGTPSGQPAKMRSGIC